MKHCFSKTMSFALQCTPALSLPCPRQDISLPENCSQQSPYLMNRIIRLLTLCLTTIFLLLLLTSAASAQEDLVSRRMIEIGNRSGFSYEQAVSSHFLMRYSVGLSLNQVLNPSRESGLTYSISENPANSDLGTQVEEHKGKNGFHFVSQHFGISPFLSVAARWYPHPLEENGGFYLQLAGEYIPNQWTLIKMGDYPSDIASVMSFPLSAGYSFHLAEGWDLRIAGRLIGGALHNKPNNKWETLLTTGVDFGVSYNF